MDKLVLDKRDSSGLLAIGDNKPNVVLVAGNNDINLLLQYAALDVKSREERCIYSVSTFNEFDKEDAAKILKYMQDDKIAKKMFYDFLASMSSSDNDVIVKSDGEIIVGDRHEDFSYSSLDDIGEWFKYLFEIALKVFIVSDGIVIVNNINLNIGIDTYRKLFFYISKMAAYRNNTVLIATDCITAVKGLSAFVAKNDDFMTTLVTIKGNNASNCKIFEIAESEHKVTSDLLASLSA